MKSKLRQAFEYWFGESLTTSAIVTWKWLFSFSDVSQDGGKGSLIAIDQAIEDRINGINQFRSLIAQQQAVYQQLEGELRQQEHQLKRQTEIAQDPRTPENAALLAAQYVINGEELVASFKQGLDDAAALIEQYTQNLRDEEMAVEQLKQEAEFAKLSQKQTEAMEKLQKLVDAKHLPSGSNARFSAAKDAINLRKDTAAANQQLTASSVQGTIASSNRSHAMSAAQDKLRQLRGQ